MAQTATFLTLKWAACDWNVDWDTSYSATYFLFPQFIHWNPEIVSQVTNKPLPWTFLNHISIIIQPIDTTCCNLPAGLLCIPKFGDSSDNTAWFLWTENVCVPPLHLHIITGQDGAPRYQTANTTSMKNICSVHTVLRYSWWWTVDLSETRKVLYQINLRNSAARWLLL
jgi:hypothetical protein